MPERGKTGNPLNQADEIAEVGSRRLKEVDESAVTLQVLSVVGPGANLWPPKMVRAGREPSTTR